MAVMVSVIVPVYNAEKTLPRCIESVLGQEYTDFELIAADDGSTDSSGEILDRYAREDPRVRVLHKENTGVSDTRNRAIAAARGKYLQFVDGDDWIASDATKRLVRAAEENRCDLVISDFYRVVGTRISHKGDIAEKGVLSRGEYAAHMMENPADFYYGVLWNKLYRREIVEKSGLRMDPRISWCEDFMFNLEYLRHADRFLALQVPLYYYVRTKGSLASQNLSLPNTIRIKRMVFECYNRFYKELLSEEEYQKSRPKIYKFLFDAAEDGVVPPVILPGARRLGEERAAVSGEVLESSGLLQDAFRDRMLLQHYLEPVAQQYDITLAETRLLLYLSKAEKIGTRRELADLTNLSRSSLSRALKKLEARGLITLKEVKDPAKKGKQLALSFEPAADPVLEALAGAEQDCEEARLAGLSPEELAEYRRLCRKIKANIQNILQG